MKAKGAPMSEILDDIAYLSQEIGPRPAGTEEEQQAALYITEQLQKSAGFAAGIEDFSCAAQVEAVKAICFGIPLIFSVGAVFKSILVIPACIISLVCAVLYLLEVLDKPFLSRAFERGVSQNVVSKYTPGGSGSARSRKVVLVTHYDSGKVQTELNGSLMGIYPSLQKVSIGALVALPILWLVRALPLAGAEGTILAAFNALAVIAMVLSALPVAVFFIHKASTYNEGANSNASGVAVLLETARRIAAGSVSEDELAARDMAEIHGEDAARAAGVVPEGADIEYMVSPSAGVHPEGADLESAKAAVAALTGQPVRQYAPAPTDISGNLVQVKEPAPGTLSPEAAAAQRAEAQRAFSGAAFQAAASPVPAAASDDFSATEGASASQGPSESESSVPDWFKTGREKANKPAFKPGKPVRRSRYADALDAAVAASSAHFEEANRAVDKEAEERLQHMRDGIFEIQAPTVESPELTMTPAPSSPASAVEIPTEAPTVPDAYEAPVAYEEEETAFMQGDALPEEPFAGRFIQPNQQEAFQQPEPEQSVPTEPFDAMPSEQDEYPDAGATTAMPPLDVSALRSASAASRTDAARTLQKKPSRRLETAARNDVDRVVYDETENGFAPEYDFSQISVPTSVPRPVPSEAPSVQQKPSRTHAARPIVLPDVKEPNLPPVADMSKQRAPLAEAEESGGKQAARSLLSSRIPRINVDESGRPAAVGQMADNKRAALRNTLPSLSGTIPTVAPASSSPEGNAAVSLTGSFAPASATGTFAPVGDELVSDVAPDDLYIEDADDSSYDANVTETGAFAGPGYMDMPESRMQRLFSRFRKGKKKTATEESASSWLNVDEGFNPTEVGAQRGGWESFQEGSGYEQESPVGPHDDYFESEFEEDYRDDSYDAAYDPDGDPHDGRKWNGGAFSKMRSMVSSSDTDSAPDEIPAEDASALTREYVPVAPASEQHRRETKMVYGFRNPDVDVEVWFVALGSELAGNGGSKAFFREHAQELRGAVIVNIESLGAGDLSYIEREGFLQSKSPSSRMKRYIKKAASASGVSASTARINWRESIASIAMKRGFQAMSMVGMDGIKPAMLAQGDDVLENVDESRLNANADFVMGLIKNI
jgi:hypothetical protein